MLLLQSSPTWQITPPSGCSGQNLWLTLDSSSHLDIWSRNVSALPLPRAFLTTPPVRSLAQAAIRSYLDYFSSPPKWPCFFCFFSLFSFLLSEWFLLSIRYIISSLHQNSSKTCHLIQDKIWSPCHGLWALRDLPLTTAVTTSPVTVSIPSAVALGPPWSSLIQSSRLLPRGLCMYYPFLFGIRFTWLF